MLLPTPFHSRTSDLCKSARWRNWSGYAAVVTYEPTHEYEYYAVRNGSGLFDVSPLRKYEISGPDAASLVSRIITRDPTRCRVGQVLYTTWCDEAGKMIDDGTVQRLEQNLFRITSADPNLRWFQDCGLGMDAVTRDVTVDLAALALQGPTSREILKGVVTGVDLDALRFFHMADATVGQIPVTVSRTGYTGDLGYELWVAPSHAEALWDALMEVGRGHGIAPAGLDALDIARIEAALILKEVDYISTTTALIESRKSSPFEAGLGWTVQQGERRGFVGARALQTEARHPSRWTLAGIEVDWPAIEKLFNSVNLPPLVAGAASRAGVPLYGRGRQIGYATSSTFSPILKRYVALATIERDFATPGTRIEFELTVEFVRHKVPARVVDTPFFDPERKRA
jgi:aminomethyltransferase